MAYSQGEPYAGGGYAQGQGEPPLALAMAYPPQARHCTIDNTLYIWEHTYICNGSYGYICIYVRICMGAYVRQLRVYMCICKASPPKVGSCASK